jgi:rSAM/selenodomain-associated transferase 1
VTLRRPRAASERMPLDPAPVDAALALFAKAPLPGRVKTRLVPPLTPEEAAGVARALLLATIESLVAALPARWTLFLDGPPDDGLRARAAARDLEIVNQASGDLGARLGEAFRRLRAAGARRVIALGADGPTLPPERLADAIDALAACDVVLGPTEDGGYYLVGSAVEGEEIFREIPWSTGAVLATTLDRAAEAGLSVRLLPPWYDVDSMGDLRRLRGEVSGGDAPPALRELLESLNGRI